MVLSSFKNKLRKIKIAKDRQWKQANILVLQNLSFPKAPLTFKDLKTKASFKNLPNLQI